MYSVIKSYNYIIKNYVQTNKFIIKNTCYL